MDLTTYRMQLIQRSNDPDLIKGVAEKGFAFPYAKFLISNNHDIPDVILNALVGNSQHAAEIAIKMKLRNREVSDNIIRTIATNPTICVAYAERLYSSHKEVEPEIFAAITKNPAACKSYVRKAIEVNINLPISRNIYECIEDDSRLCLALAKEYIRQGKKNYNDLDRTLINSIASDHYAAENFAHFLQPFVDETPEEILSAIQNHQRIRTGWHKGSGNEKFAEFFRARNQ